MGELERDTVQKSSGAESFSGAELAQQLMSVKAQNSAEPKKQLTTSEREKLQRLDEYEMDQTVKAINRIRPSIDELVHKLRPGIKGGEWSSVIGDDVGGRLPSLLIGELMQGHAREHGQASPQRLFLAGGRDQGSRMEALDRYIGEIKALVGPRALFVTEYIETGGTIKDIVGLFKKHGINCDIATVQLNKETFDNGLNDADKITLDGVNIIFGRDVESAPELYLTKKVAGVTKQPNQPITSRVSIPEEQRPLDKPSKTLPDVVATGRRMMAESATVLYEKYFKKEFREVTPETSQQLSQLLDDLLKNVEVKPGRYGPKKNMTLQLGEGEQLVIEQGYRRDGTPAASVRVSLQPLESGQPIPETENYADGVKADVYYVGGGVEKDSYTDYTSVVSDQELQRLIGKITPHQIVRDPSRSEG
jgi:hypothetical protein